MMSLATGYAQHIAPASAPNETQKRLQERGYGMFIHFGVNTFADMEWSDGTIPVEQYNPTSLDCDQWVRVARDAGFRYVLSLKRSLSRLGISMSWRSCSIGVRTTAILL